MINGKRIAVVMPAYNAEKTLEMTVSELTSKFLLTIPAKTKPLTSPGNWAYRLLFTTPTMGMGATSKPATARLSPRAPTSW
jgi:hypothetical protein